MDGMLMLISLSSVIIQDKTQGWSSDHPSSPQLIRQGQGKVMILTVARLGGGAFLCEAKNAIGSQRSRLVLLASASTGEEADGAFLHI